MTRWGEALALHFKAETRGRLEAPGHRPPEGSIPSNQDGERGFQPSEVWNKIWPLPLERFYLFS